MLLVLFRFSPCFENVLKWRIEKTKKVSFEVALALAEMMCDTYICHLT